jgi:GMP synthase (glutamine-hydrolysing)
MKEPQKSDWLVLRHVEHEHIGTLAAAFERAGVAYRYRDVFRGEPVPQQLTDCGGLVLMGGPMGVYEQEQYPFLAREEDLIRRAAAHGLSVLGICLGAQLIASALGSRVYTGPRKEIGWHPVEVAAPDDELTANLPSEFMGFHWHGDTFDLPAGATRLFRSKLYENQGFRYGSHVLALQFHGEVDSAMVADWLEDGGCRAELASVPNASADTIRQQTARWANALENVSASIFDTYLRTVKRDK